MPTYQDDATAVRLARQKQASLNAESAQITAGAQTFGDRVMGKVRQARADRGISAMQQGVGTTTGQLVSDPQRIYDYAGTDVNPMTLDRYTSAARASNLSTLATADQFNADTGQTIEDTISAGTNQILAKAALKKAEADKAQQEADTLMEQVRMRQEEERLNMSKSGAAKKKVNIPGFGEIELTDAEIAGLWKGGMIGDQSANVELKSNQQKDMNFYKNIYKAAQTAESNQQDKFTGLADYLMGGVRKIAGSQSQQETSMRSAISEHNTAIRNKISGTAVSKEESKALKDMLIKGTDNDYNIKQKFAASKDMALRGAGTILSTSGYDIDPLEYFMKDAQIGGSGITLTGNTRGE